MCMMEEVIEFMWEINSHGVREWGVTDWIQVFGRGGLKREEMFDNKVADKAPLQSRSLQEYTKENLAIGKISKILWT